jgi:hypothetical protein
MCINNLTHYEHARFVVHEAYNLEESVAAAAYRAACKVVHGDDPRLKMLMVAGHNFVRFDRRWATLAAETYTNDVQPILATLPACQAVNKSGKLAAVPSLLARFDQPQDISYLGYPALSPVWGIKVYGHRLPLRDPTKLPIVLHRKEFQADCMSVFRPRYLASDARRLTEEAAWRVLEGPFPGLNRDAVMLLVAAKGAAEGEVGLPPMIFISGPTGAAKTSSIMIAAGITGDSVHSVPWNYNIDRVRAALLEAKEAGSYACFNEIVKDAKAAGKEVQQAFSFLLNLTPESLSHKLYVGPVHLGSLPVCTFTDTSLPVEVIQHGQLARRMTHVHMPSRLRWDDTIKDYGISKITDFRLVDPSFADAANVLLSIVIDRFFQYPLTFEEIAAKLGYAKLEASSIMDEKRDSLRAFFEAVCRAPEIDGADAKRWKGKGWRLIQRDGASELADLWKSLCDECFTSSEKCNETDWAALLERPGPITFEIRSHGSSRLAVRFVRRQNRSEYEVVELPT